MTTKDARYMPRLLALAVLAGAFLYSPAAHAQPAAPIAGCDSTVMDAMTKRAATEVAGDVASTEGISDAPKGKPRSGINKPDSVLFLSCFNSAAGNTAANIGPLFGGDFTSAIGGSGGGSGGTSIIPDALTAWGPNFQGSIGSDTGVVSYTNTALDTNIDKCQDTTSTTTPSQALMGQVLGQGTPNQPFVLDENRKTGTLPDGLVDISGGNSNFKNDWNQSQSDNIFSDYKTAADILKNSAPNGSGPGAPKIPNFSTFFPMTGQPATAPTSCALMAATTPPIATSCP